MIEPFSIIEVLEKRKNTKAKIAEGVEVGDILRISVELSLQSGKPTIVIAKYLGSGDYNDSSNFTYINRTEGGNLYKVYTDEEASSAPILFREISKKSLLKGVLYKTVEKTINDSNQSLQNVAYLVSDSVNNLSKVSLPVLRSKGFDLKKEIQLTVNDRAFNYIETLDNSEWNDRNKVFENFKDQMINDVFDSVVDVLVNAGYTRNELGV
jgi:hypothetical protein